MAVAYVPAFLEDRAIFIKERANGLYGPSSFIVSNFIIGLPYLCTYVHCHFFVEPKLIKATLNFSFDIGTILGHRLLAI